MNYNNDILEQHKFNNYKDNRIEGDYIGLMETNQIYTNQRNSRDRLKLLLLISVILYHSLDSFRSLVSSRHNIKEHSILIFFVILAMYMHFSAKIYAIAVGNYRMCLMYGLIGIAYNSVILLASTPRDLIELGTWFASFLNTTLFFFYVFKL